MSDDLLYNSGRPRRTRSSIAAGITPSTSNPYKKPTYSVRRSNNPTPDDSADDASNDVPGTSTPPQRRKPGRPFGSVTKNRSSPGTPRGRGNGRGRGGRGGRGASNGSSSRNSDTPNTVPTLTLRKRSSASGNTPTTWTASKGRPECVAHRNDRRSISSMRGRKKRRGYGTNDYHYGSDFESDQAEESEPDDAVDEAESDSAGEAAEDDMQLDEPLDSDSDVSIGSTRLLGLQNIPVPLWLDSEANVEELEIPRSSDDLLLNRSLLIDAIAIYEPIRRFSNLVRLTPFRFEDFCAAVVSEEQSSLLAEIHIQLLKALIREDEAIGTCFAPNECKDSVQSVLFFTDNMTWAECLRSYMESDPAWGDIYKVMTSVEYPFCGPEIRVQVLAWLIDAFMVGNSVRDLLMQEGKIAHEDHCRACNRLGELICCETCPAVYHLACISLKSDDEDPPDDWQCPVCERHELLGVTDCVSEVEKAGLLFRQEALGCDRHGRKYWFLVRRIIVESEDKSEIWYYSTRLQVEELVFRLDGENCEKTLVENILFHKDEIFRQMGITESITAKMNTNHRKTYLDAENAFLTKIHEERELIRAQELAEKSRIEEQARLAIKKELEEKQRAEEEARLKKEEEKRKIREERLAKRNQIKLKQRLGNIPGMDESLEQFLLNDESKDSIADHDDVVPKDEDDLKPGELEPNSPILENGDVKEENEEFNFNEAETQRIVDLPPQLEPEGTLNAEDVEQKMEVDEEVEVKTEEAEVKTEEVKAETEEVKKEEVKLDPKDLEPLVKTSILPKIAAKSKSLSLEVDSEERMTRLRSTGFYKLGQEGSFRTYVNSYSTDVLALSKSQHTDERDKRRTMSHKFSLTQASECKWSGVQQGLRTSIVGTIRQTLLNMEIAIPVTLMHCNWNAIRKTWMSAVIACSNATEFAKALATFTAGLRPSVFNPVWSESGGHLKLLRTTPLLKEIRKKNEKLDKKYRDEEEDRLKNFPQFVKYTIPPKHMVWKQKGEEFRLHGHYGWLWLSIHRSAKPKDSRKMGLLAGPHKHVIQVKGNAGKVKTMLIDPEVYDKLMAKRAVSIEQKKVDTVPKPEPKETTTPSIEDDVNAVMENLLADIEAGREEPTPTPASSVKIEKPVPPAPKPPQVEQQAAETKNEKQESSPSRKFRTELINVSLGIVSANRILYPKIAREVPALDSLLARRIKLQEMEEKELLDEFGAAIIESTSGPLPELDKSPIVIKIDSSFPLGGGYSLSCFSYECQKAAKEGKTGYESICYSPMCRLKAVIMNSRKRKIERERLVDYEKRKKFRMDILERRCYNQTSTSEKVKLKTLPEDKKKDRQVVKYPPSPKFCYHRTKKSSILVLPQHDLNQLARSGARKLIPLGFNANPKPNAWLWPYPSGRPLFRTTWQYRTAVQTTSLHAAALQLRVLYACVRWDDIQMKPLNPDGKSHVTTDMEVITSEILNHRIVGRFQEAFQYLRRRHIVPIDAPKTIREVTPSRSGLRKRKRAESPDLSHPEVKEEWVEEEKFEVWEIRLYGEKLEKKNEKKPEPPSSSTRTKTGVALKVPEKWDPSPKETIPKEKEIPTPVVPTPIAVSIAAPTTPTPTTKFLPVTISSPLVIKDEPELRIAHPSKRDNHAKITTVTKTPTASQQLLQQQQTAAAAAAAAANQGVSVVSSSTPKVISLTQTTSPTGRKFFTAKPSIGSIRAPSVTTKELPKTGILKKQIIASPLAVGTAQNISATSLMNSTTPLSGTIIRPTQTPQQVTNAVTNQKVQIIRTEDGTVQVNGLLPGQTAYQTPDGNVHVINTASASAIMEKKGFTPLTQAPVNVYRAVTPVGQPRVNISNPAFRTAISTPTQNLAPRALVRPAEPRKAAMVKQALAPSIIRVNRTAEDLKEHSLHLQIGRSTIEVKHKDIVKSAAGEDQIHLGPGLPIIQLLSARLPEPAVISAQPEPVPETPSNELQSQFQESPTEPPPLQQVQQTVPVQQEQQQVMSVGMSPASIPPSVQPVQEQTTAQIVTSSIPTVMAAGSKIMYNEGNRSFVLNTTGYTEAQVQALVQQLQEKKIIIKGTEAATQVPQQQQPQIQQGQQILLPQGLMQGQVLVQQQQQQPIMVQSSIPQNTVLTTVAPGSQMPQRLVATIGGQKVFFTRGATTLTPGQRTITPVGGQPNQVFQRLVVPASSIGMTYSSSPKSLISVTPPVTQVNYRSPQPRQIMTGPLSNTNVSPTGAPLPISIVSPSKPRLTHQAAMRIDVQSQHQTQVSQTPPATTTSPGHPGIMTSQQLTGLLQQRQVTAIATPAPLTSVRIPTTLTSSPRTQFVQLQSNATMNQNVTCTPPRLPTILRPVTPVTSPQKPKVIAQVVQTPEGPCLKVQGIPANISPSMLAHLDAQLSKQMPGILRKDGLGSILAAAGIQVTSQGSPPPTGVTSVTSPTPTPCVPSITQTIRPRLLTPARKPIARSPRVPRPIVSTRFPEPQNVLTQPQEPIPAPAEVPISVPTSLEESIGTGIESNFGINQIDESMGVTMGVAEEVTIPSAGNTGITKRPRTVSNELRTRSPSPKKRKMSELSVSSFSELPAVTASAPEKFLASPPHEYEDSEAEARFVLSQDLVQSEPMEVPEMSGEEVLSSFVTTEVNEGPPTDIMESPSSTSEVTSPTTSAIPALNSLSPDIVHETVTQTALPVVESPQPPVPLPVVSPPTPKVTKRKSSVKSDGAKSAQAAFQKSLHHLYKHKELLKKDLAKKRELLDKDLLIEIQAEIMEELKKQDDLTEEITEEDEDGNEQKGKPSEARPVMKTSKGRASLPSSGKSGKATTKKAKSRKKDVELFCTCQKPYDRNKFYVGCDKCDKWYHGECVGITEEMSRLLSEYICLECQNAPPVKLYCICQKPYDDTQFYIACDKCDDWLHGRCVGILPIEGDKMDQFVCKTCDPMTPLNLLNAQSLKPDDFMHLEKLVRQIKTHKSATPFRKPVDVSLAPNYFRVIKDPMDLCEVERRVDQRRYLRLPEFIRDMSLIFENCRYFNQPESQFFRSANVLEAFFARKLKDLRRQLASSAP